MNSKMTTNSQLSTAESKHTHTHTQTDKEAKQNKKLSKQPEQEQNHRYGDHLEGYQLGGEGEVWGERCSN